MTDVHPAKMKAYSSNYHCSDCVCVSFAGQLYSIVLSMSKEHVLSAGFDINTPDNFGRTCLHAAASGG